MMDIKTFTVADLKGALESDNFWLADPLPITKHRARSFIRNPRAEPNDPVLLIAYQDDRVVGYIGILPDHIFVDEISYKLGWLTSWWVDRSCAGAGVGTILLFKALNAYNQQIGLSGSSRDARKALDASRRFVAVRSLNGLDIRLRLNLSRRIPRKSPAMKPFRVVFKVLDVVLDDVMNIRRYIRQPGEHTDQHLSFEFISAIDNETDQFIRQHNQKDLTRKAKSDLDWIMNSPWIISTPIKDSTSERYYFSSRAKRFFYLGLKVFRRDAGLIGFLLFKMRNDRMGVMYSFFDSIHAPSLAAAAVRQALAMEASVLSLYDDRLIAGFSRLGCPCWSVKRISRGFSLSKAFADASRADFRIQGGDGDLVFY